MDEQELTAIIKNAVKEDLEEVEQERKTAEQAREHVEKILVLVGLAGMVTFALLRLFDPIGVIFGSCGGFGVLLRGVRFLR